MLLQSVATEQGHGCNLCCELLLQQRRLVCDKFSDGMPRDVAASSRGRVQKLSVTSDSAWHAGDSRGLLGILALPDRNTTIRYDVNVHNLITRLLIGRRGTENP